jgi:hypothetical protein
MGNPAVFWRRGYWLMPEDLLRVSGSKADTSWLLYILKFSFPGEVVTITKDGEYLGQIQAVPMFEVVE